VDIWSVGCILGEMIHGEAIFPGTSTLNQVELILRLIGRPSDEDIDSLNCHTSHFIIKSLKLNNLRNWNTFFPDAEPEALDFIRECLKFDPKTRPTIDQLLKHPYLELFRGSEKDNLIRDPLDLEIDDSSKFCIKNYRNALYKNIAKHKKLGLIKSLKKSQLAFKNLGAGKLN
jgi:mitogen-activated protein kinase 15